RAPRAQPQQRRTALEESAPAAAHFGTGQSRRNDCCDRSRADASQLQREGRKSGRRSADQRGNCRAAARLQRLDATAAGVDPAHPRHRQGRDTDRSHALDRSHDCSGRAAPQCDADATDAGTALIDAGGPTPKRGRPTSPRKSRVDTGDREQITFNAETAEAAERKCPRISLRVLRSKVAFLSSWPLDRYAALYENSVLVAA